LRWRFDSSEIDNQIAKMISCFCRLSIVFPRYIHTEVRGFGEIDQDERLSIPCHYHAPSIRKELSSSASLSSR
jgi:hypothetical protein